MLGVSRTVLNSSPVQKMYEEGLVRNASGSETGLGLVGRPTVGGGLVGGNVRNSIKKAIPRATRKNRRRVSRAVHNTLGQGSRILQKGTGRKKSMRRGQKGRGGRKPVGPRITIRKRKSAGKRRKVIKGRGRQTARSKKQTGGARRRQFRSRAIKI